MKFTSAGKIEKCLPQGGAPIALEADLTNPTSSASGVFGGQVLALQLNVDFSNAGIILGTANSSIAGLKLVNTGTSLDGHTISQILSLANQALGGGSLPADYTISQLNDLVTNLNQAFDDGIPSAWTLGHLSP